MTNSEQGRKTMSYIDGFVAAVPTAKRETYLKHAAEMAAIMKEFGVIKTMECWVTTCRTAS